MQSAAVRTVESFAFTYGRVEVRAKLPRGDWLWPAIWLLPKWHQYGDWPTSGEIDIMESRGNAPSTYPNQPGNDVLPLSRLRLRRLLFTLCGSSIE